MEEKRSVRKRKRKKDYTKVRFWVFLGLAMGLILVAAFAPYLTPYDPDKQELLKALQPPSTEHWMGTDRYGRDLFSRVIMGAQPTIFSALTLVAVISIFGTAVGLFCGFVGGKLDEILMRISDIFLAFPGMVFAVAVAGVLGGGISNAVIALAAISWPKFARIARSQTLTVKNTPYIAAARLGGCSGLEIACRHVLPNILGPVIVTATLDIGVMMMELAGLSFLGLGAQPPTAEWGSMMSSGRSMLQTAPWVILAPGFAIFLSVMIFNLLGDTVRDVMDPRQRQRGIQPFVKKEKRTRERTVEPSGGNETKQMKEKRRTQ